MKTKKHLSEAETMLEAKKLTSYASDAAGCAKMWILPDGRVVSIPVQHYEWALGNAERLRDDYGIYLSRLKRREDTPIRLHLLSKGCVRVNYEQRCGKITLEANHMTWGERQRASYRLVVKRNVSDIYFIRVGLLSKSGKPIPGGYADFTQLGDRAKMNKLPLISYDPQEKRAW
ncbi:MAG: hypothetical protein JWM16_6416 [Verrucomicrobiales bacterium]|nr:hypothetical protein [Verrucomicrobiales bacterium]